MNKTEEKAFFNALAIEMNTISLEEAKNAYRALTRLILRAAQEGKGTKLPEFGEFVVVTLKEAVRYNVNTKEKWLVPPVKMLRFKAKNHIRKYINI